MMNDQDLIRELGLQNLPPEKQEETLASIGRIIYQGVLIRVMEQLSDSQKNEFEVLLERNADEEAIYEFLSKNVPDLDKLVEHEVAKFKADTLAALHRPDAS
jgi:hypothetical protein